ncbi:MAG: RNA polymerase sigma-70 factor [Gemmatimonadales bacterium]
MTHESRTDPLSELAQRVRTGDVAAFEQLFRSLHAQLCEVVDSYVRSQAIAEEIVQDLFFVLWTTRDRLPAPRSFRGYLFAAARNRALHHLRHRAVVQRWSARVDTHAEVAGTGAPLPGPDEALQADERSRAIQRAVAQLPPRTRVAFVLRWEHEMSHADIATAMGISVKGVEKLLTAARSKLRELLAAEADSPAE